MGFIDALDALIDRPCQRKDCRNIVPESSPSDDFCSEYCESAWRAENNGCDFVRSFGGGEVVVPEGHPAEPTHQPSTGLTVPEPDYGLGQILSSMWENYWRAESERHRHDRYREWARTFTQRPRAEEFGFVTPNDVRRQIGVGDFRIVPHAGLQPGQAFIVNPGGDWQAHGIVEGFSMGMDGEMHTFLSVDPAASIRSVERLNDLGFLARPLSEGERRADDLARISRMLDERARMQRQIAEAFAIPARFLGFHYQDRIFWGDIPHFGDRTHVVHEDDMTIGQRWADQFRDDWDVVLDACDAVIDFLFYRVPEQVAAWTRRAWRFVTRS
jgi:hypothetical protein